jgi:hypothetical protein
VGLFTRRKNVSPAYAHYEAPAADLNGGGGTWVFEPSFGLPGILARRGSGRDAGTFYATEAPLLSLFPTGVRNDILQNSTGTIYSQEVNYINPQI